MLVKRLKIFSNKSIINTLLIAGFAISFEILPDTVADINKQIQQLQLNYNNLTALSNQLTATYNKLQNELLNEIESAIKKSINPQKRVIKNAIASINDIPKAILKVVNIGDLPKALQALDNILDETVKILNNIKERFDKTMQGFNKKTDPKNIYKDIQASQKAMQDSIAQLQELANFVKELGI